MAEITIKLFGVFRTDTHLAKETINATTIDDIFPVLNDLSLKIWEEKNKVEPGTKKPDPIQFKDAVVYVNGERKSKKSYKVNNGDEVWIMSPASGG